MRRTRMLIFIGLMIAADIVLTRLLSFTASGIRIGFAFIPVVLTAAVFGPWASVLVAMLSDVLGYLLLPMNGPLSPLITLCQGLIALIYGLFLYRRDLTLPRITIAALVQGVVVSVGLMTLALSFNEVLVSVSSDFFGLLTHWGDAAYRASVTEVAGQQFNAFLATYVVRRLIQNAVMIPIQILVIFSMKYVLAPLKKIAGAGQA